MTKSNRNHGFTLVELIVVLVILAILAALLVPALTGYIDKAKKSQVIAETRMLTQAAQTELSSLYATDAFAAQCSASTSFTVASKDGSGLTFIGSDKQFLTNLKERYNDIVNLSELSCLKNNGKGYFFVMADKSAKIQFTVYNDGKGYFGIYSAEDGSMTAFKDEEVPHYDNWSIYNNKVFCTPIYESDGSKYWTKNNLYASLGIKNYDAKFDTK